MKKLLYPLPTSTLLITVVDCEEGDGEYSEFLV